MGLTCMVHDLARVGLSCSVVVVVVAVPAVVQSLSLFAVLCCRGASRGRIQAGRRESYVLLWQRVTR